MPMKYYSGDIELTNIRHDGLGSKPANFMGIAGKPVFVPGQGFGPYVKAERIIEYKASPSRHSCDARCYNATGKIMRCECACGGKNHGLGKFICAA